ncbi:MAG: hypothetical protein C0173_05295 [Desulfurella sp.]|uniref:DUF4282 domain-containing protein n=1 Tax=Desulfurella sp. TaxID=1962857 RepID=UPI000CBC4438|nr:DUF4282 domain-containing protein [Desulfurella sp.]PMP89743.1 MAG: hypothetical protein C0173_05295 [Desulfurella sp.]HEX13477.1 DUF2116 family Zn-ribbon domain-containing protein [Desulfurella acetivorans]
MFCPNCGTQIPDDSKFCPSCGTRFDKPQSKNTNDFVNSVLFLKEMLTPKLLQFFYWLSLFGIALISIGMMTRGVYFILAAPIVFVLLFLLIRVYFEFIIVVFRIYEELKQINEKNKLV